MDTAAHERRSRPVRLARPAGVAAIVGAVLVIVASRAFLMFPPGTESRILIVPSSWVVGPAYTLGALLLTAALVGLEHRYVSDFDDQGRLVLTLMALALVASALTRTGTLQLLGIELTGALAALSSAVALGRFVLASALGVQLTRTESPRLQAALFIVALPLGVAASPLLLDNLTLLALADVTIAIAFALLGEDLLSTRSRDRPTPDGT